MVNYILQALIGLTPAPQKKAGNFYTNANVKNKNRAKVALLKSLQAKNGGRNRERQKKR
jgi:nuclear GTP-binding protein